MKKKIKGILIAMLLLAVIGFVGLTYYIGLGVFEGMTNAAPREQTVENETKFNMEKHKKFA